MSAPAPPFVQDLDVHVRARYPLIWLVTPEEGRLDAVLEALALEHGKELWSWSIASGLRPAFGPRRDEVPKSRTPLEALDAVEKIAQPALIALKDFHPYLQDPQVVRRLRELGFRLKGTYKTACLISPVLSLPPELEKDVTVIDVPLPTRRELAELLRGVVAVLRQKGSVRIELARDQAARMIEAARGLTLAEAENAFAKAVVVDDRLSFDDIRLILEEKKQIIRKSGMLEYHEAEAGLADVGGNELLKAWLGARQDAFTDEARRYGLPAPKGLLLLGVQGCGKSLTARAVAGAWGLPLLRLDMGRIFAGLVGSSEENMRKAIRVADTVAPVVLWIDEIEKGLSGIGAGDLDSGVSSRVFGTFLTWMQEKTAPVFVVATANRIDALPPELLRKGRFDEIFFVDLPGPKQRADIFAIHLRRRGRDPAVFDLDRLAAASPGFSGAEIEMGIGAALYDAFARKEELAQAHVERALSETHPLSRTMREEIEGLRRWARDRTRPAGETTAAGEVVP